MSARGASRLGDLAAELREQVPAQFLPEESDSLRAAFKAADPIETPGPAVAPAASLDQEPAFEIEDIEAAPANAAAPRAKEAEQDTGLELEAEPEPAEPDINVVDTPGESDLHEQQQSVSAVHEEAGEMERRLNAQAQKAVSDGKDFESSVNGYRTGVSWTGAAQADNAEKKRKEADEKFTQAMLKKMLDDHIKWLDEQIAYWREQERQWEERGDAIEDAIAALDRGERIEVDENGLALDAKLREAQLAYQRTYNRLPDVNDRDSLLRLQRFADEQSAIARQQAEQREREREQAQKLREEMERDPDDPATQQRVRDLKRSTEGRQQLGDAVANSEDVAFRETAYTEGATTRQDQTIAAEASVSADDYFANADDGFEGDGFAGGTSVAKTADPQNGNLPTLTPAFQFAASADNAAEIEDPAQRVATLPSSIPSRSV